MANAYQNNGHFLNDYQKLTLVIRQTDEQEGTEVVLWYSLVGAARIPMILHQTVNCVHFLGVET